MIHLSNGVGTTTELSHFTRALCFIALEVGSGRIGKKRR
jgi:hypothetical protein